MKMQPKNQAIPLTSESFRAQYLASGEKSSLLWAANQIQVVDPAEVKKLILGLDDNGVEFLLVMFNFFHALAAPDFSAFLQQTDPLHSQGREEGQKISLPKFVPPLVRRQLSEDDLQLLSDPRDTQLNQARLDEQASAPVQHMPPSEQ